MPEVVCPECGTHTELVAIRRSSEEFCTHCDYPLFWAPSALPETTRGVNHDTTLRRLPGAGGRQRLGSVVCPDCGELNPLGDEFCIRCDAELHPAPPPPEPPPAPAPTPVPPPPEDSSINWWWLVFLVVSLAAIVVGYLYFR